MISDKCPYGLCDGSGVIWDSVRMGGNQCKCMSLRIMESKLKFAEIPKEFKDYKVNDFDTQIYGSEENRTVAYTAKKIAVGYINNFDTIKLEGKGLYFYSYTKGSGKTRLAASIGNALIKKYFMSVRFVTTNNLLDEIKSTFVTDSKEDEYSKLIEEIKRVEILILDDVGAERPTGWVNEIFYNILNDSKESNHIYIKLQD